MIYLIISLLTPVWEILLYSINIYHDSYLWIKYLFLLEKLYKWKVLHSIWLFSLGSWWTQTVRLDISALAQYKLPYTHRLYTYKQTEKCVRTCFIGGGVCRHTPCAGLAAFGHHDRELIHGVGLQSRDRVTECRRIRRLTTTHTHTRFGSRTRRFFAISYTKDTWSDSKVVYHGTG